MKILLINPYIREKIENSQEQIIDSFLERTGTNIYKCPPLPLYLLAAYLENDECTFIDEPNGDELPKLEQFDLILVTASTCQAKRANEIGKLAQEKSLYAVVGGTHATIEPEYFKSSFNTVFSGEVEETFPKFIENFRDDNFYEIKKLYKSETINLKLVPVARYDLIEKNKYDFIPLQVSRGCPNGCNYCASSTLYGRKIRIKNIEVIKKEIELIDKYHRGKVVYITDDNFIKLDENAIEIIELLNEKNIRYICYGDVSLIDNLELIDKLTKNCVKLLVGLDSLNEENLKFYAPYKVKYLSRYVEFVKLIQSKGIGIFGSFIVGFDFDKESIFDEMIEFIEETLISEICLSILVPMPGAKLRQILEKDDRILDIDYSYYDGFHLLFKEKNLNEKELHKGIEKVMEKYLSKELIVKRVKFFKKNK